MRLTTLTFASLVLALTACTASSSDDTDESAGAQSTRANLLSICPALENVAFEAIVIGDASTRVKMSYLVSGYTDDNDVQVPPRTFNDSIQPSTFYGLRFYRDARGATKFQLTVGSYHGIEERIEGPKQLAVSGTVTPDEANSRTAGELVITSRRDAFRAIAGDVTKIAFSGLDCESGSTISATLPVITLEKASDATEVFTDSDGATATVSKSVKWVKKADAAPLTFRPFFGD